VQAALQTLRASVDHAALEPVYDTIARVRQDLPPAVTFLGFCGAPWTVATYMIAGQGTPQPAAAPDLFCVNGSIPQVIAKTC
jgi:uroporphyrinogen decarboxylase